MDVLERTSRAWTMLWPLLVHPLPSAATAKRSPVADLGDAVAANVRALRALLDTLEHGKSYTSPYADEGAFPRQWWAAWSAMKDPTTVELHDIMAGTALGVDSPPQHTHTHTLRPALLTHGTARYQFASVWSARAQLMNANGALASMPPWPGASTGWRIAAM